MRKKECESCQHWRFKSSDDQRAFGMCDRLRVDWKVSIINEAFLRRYLPPETEEWIIIEILKSPRTEGTFLCNQYERREQ